MIQSSKGCVGLSGSGGERTAVWQREEQQTESELPFGSQGKAQINTL